MSYNYFLVSLYLSWSLPQNNQSYIDTGTGWFLWFFIKFKNKEPTINCQEGFLPIYTAACSICICYQLTCVILLKAGRFSLRAPKEPFSHSKKLSGEASLVTHTDSNHYIFQSNSMSTPTCNEERTWCKKMFLFSKKPIGKDSKHTYGDS